VTVRSVYLDCEFLPADPTNTGLVSIGLTDDQGVDYYAVNAEMDVDALLAVPWMVNNVWRYLPRIAFGYDEDRGVLNHDDSSVRSIATIKADIAAYFADTRASQTRLYAYYGGQDIGRLHMLWDNNWALMPEYIPQWFTEIQALIVDAGNPRMPMQDSGEHHALADARYNREMHQYLIRLKGN
jgi:hypothetical protein